MRRQLKAKLPAADHAAFESEAIRHGILRWLRDFPGGLIISSFAPLPGEVDLLPLLTAAPELRWVLPKVRGSDLSFHQVSDSASLVTGAFGIREPGDIHPEIRTGEIDLFLCPGLGFTVGGARLGRGKGFYDRALERAKPAAIRTGVTFRSQIVDAIPVESHDLRMHYLATVDGVITCEADADT